MAKIRMCEICKQPIDDERLEGTPATRLCREHATEIQKYGGEFRLTGKQEKTSKDRSFKVTLGDVITSQVRNVAGIQRLKDDYEARNFG